MVGQDGVGLRRIGLDWIGLDWIGLDWIGLDWIGLGWEKKRLETTRTGYEATRRRLEAATKSVPNRLGAARGGRGG